MAITTDDAGLVLELRQLLRESGAGWVVEEVDAELAPLAGEHTATVEVETLLVGIARSVGAIPAMLRDAQEILGVLTDDAVTGVRFGDSDDGESLVIVFDPDEMSSLDDAARALAEPVADRIDWAQSDE